jgi:hemoglobin
MEQAVSTSITRRSLVAGLTVTAASVAVLAQPDNAEAQEKTL